MALASGVACIGVSTSQLCKLDCTVSYNGNVTTFVLWYVYPYVAEYQIILFPYFFKTLIRFLG